MVVNHREDLIVSIIFHGSVNGHDFDYNRSLGQAVESIGHLHFAIVPKSWNNLLELPPRWYPCLDIEEHSARKSMLAKILGLISLSSSLSKCVKNHVQSLSNNIVLFIESFGTFQLAALFLALCQLPVKRIRIFLLFRWNVAKKPQTLLYKIIVWLIEKRVKTDSLQLFTDSVLIQNALLTYLGRTISVLPIPHTEFPVRNYSDGKKRDGCLRIWWPGSPRPAKGLSVLQAILKEKGDHARQFKIIAAKSSSLIPENGGAQLELIPDYLPRKDYERTMRESDIILLPYDKDAYHESTSGIFVEAIVAGKVPLVTAGTWMAKELQRFELEELILDWSSDGILQTVSSLLENENMIIKLKRMRESYIAYHNVSNYARSLSAFLED